MSNCTCALLFTNNSEKSFSHENIRSEKNKNESYTIFNFFPKYLKG